MNDQTHQTGFEIEMNMRVLGFGILYAVMPYYLIDMVAINIFVLGCFAVANIMTAGVLKYLPTGKTFTKR